MDQATFERMYAVEFAMAQRYLKVARAIRLASVRHYQAGRVRIAQRVYLRAEEYVSRMENIYWRLLEYYISYAKDGTDGQAAVFAMQEELPKDTRTLPPQAGKPGRDERRVPGVYSDRKPGASAAVRGDAQYNPYG